MQELRHPQNLHLDAEKRSSFSGFDKGVLAVAGIALAVISLAYLLRSFTPKIEVIQDNTYQGITPGISTARDVTEKLGEPIEVRQTQLGTELSYQSKYPTSPNQVVADSKGEVKFIKEFVDYENPPNLSDFTNKLGDYDLELFDKETGYSARAYVFLEKGIVIIAHVADNSVEQKWYFEPTDQETFLNSWGRNLTDEEHGPEKLRY